MRRSWAFSFEPLAHTDTGCKFELARLAQLADVSSSARSSQLAAHSFLMSISPARTVAFDILLRVDQQDAYASELLHSHRLDGLASDDRGLATELVMGVLRWRSRLDEAIVSVAARPIEKLDSEVLTALRLGAYQLRYLRIPAHAAINESVDLVKRARKRSAVPFANAVLRKLAAAQVEAASEPGQWDSASLARAIRSSAMARRALDRRIRSRTHSAPLPARSAGPARRIASR